MDARRVARGQWIAALGGCVLLIVMALFNWFGVKGVPGGFNAFQSFRFGPLNFLDHVLVSVAVIAVGLALLQAAQAPRLPQVAAIATVGLGILATILVIYRLIDPPELIPGGGLFGPPEVDLTRKVGIYLGALASATIALGGIVSFADRDR